MGKIQNIKLKSAPNPSENLEKNRRIVKKSELEDDLQNENPEANFIIEPEIAKKTENYGVQNEKPRELSENCIKKNLLNGKNTKHKAKINAKPEITKKPENSNLQNEKPSENLDENREANFSIKPENAKKPENCDVHGEKPRKLGETSSKKPVLRDEKKPVSD
ncbi:hypothetical protein JTB14_005217 [Gonioctena quinquepunctata]|nr:hypothetical protein JTB14_005217 [Gonioctena quinquepunctata]